MAEQIAIWRWNHITEAWERTPSVVDTQRMVAVGQVAAGARKLYWIACNPAAGNSLWEVTDDIAALGVVVLDCFSTNREAKGFVFDPPMNFTTGIYLETFTNMTSCIFGYI